MSRRSLQFRKVAAAGPIVEVKDSRGATVYHRLRKTREDFAATLPPSMKPAKRDRVIATLYGRG